MDYEAVLEMEKFVEMPFPGIKNGCKLRVLSAFVIVLGMPYFALKALSWPALASICCIFTYPNAFSLAVFLNNWFAEASIFPNFWIDGINVFDKGRGMHNFQHSKLRQG